MSLSPYQLDDVLSVRELAALLACHADPECRDPVWAIGSSAAGKLESVIAGAIERGELQPVGGDRVPVRAGHQKDGRLLPREKVRDWLKSRGAGDADVPAELWPAGEVLKQAPDADAQKRGVAADKELRALEAFGLLVELYASQHGPDYRNGARPKASRIVKDMLTKVPDDVPSMGDRKLKEHVGAAIKAWEAKKRR